MTITLQKTTEIAFSKMHGLGNDFVIIDATQHDLSIHNLPIAKWADRHRGIGFDQLLILTCSKKADIACDIFNADGSIAEQCGNGMRCVARFAYENQLVSNKKMTIETKAGIVQAELRDDGLVEVDMGSPKLMPGWLDIPLKKTIRVFALSMGNPHAIVWVDSIDTYPVAEMGRAISKHA
ncbi:MAG: diaminopimelate epimerase, partial [Gammaproteobacteria bacterium]|nr:diaminopimelate epimerase [Gammaproteobacteria bacterium]